MKSLDMNTSIFIYILLSYICTLVMTLLWFRYGRKFKEIKFFQVDFLLQSIALTIASLRGILHPAITVIIPNFFMFTGIVVFMMGMASFINVSVKRKPYYFYIGLFTMIYSYFTVIQIDVRVRIILFTALTTPIFLHVIYLIFIKSDLEHKRYASGVGVVCIFFVGLNMLRFYYAFSGGMILDYFSTPLMDTFFVILSQALIVMLTFSLELMIINKLSHQADKGALEREMLLEKTKLLATIDSLTQIYNRRKIEELLLNEVERFNRYQIPFSVLLADIDNFKRFNDRYGHDVGDQALVDVTRILRENIRKLDYLGRWGGEEFLIILPGIKRNYASKTAERLRSIIVEYNAKYLNEDDRISLSIGVIEYTQDSDIKTLLKDVDGLLYKAKNSGRNRVEVYQKTEDRNDEKSF